MGAMASQITSLTIVYPTIHSDADQRKRQSSASLAFYDTSEATVLQLVVHVVQITQQQAHPNNQLCEFMVWMKS